MVGVGVAVGFDTGMVVGVGLGDEEGDVVGVADGEGVGEGEDEDVCGLNVTKAAAAPLITMMTINAITILAMPVFE